ncbi:MAG: protein-export chaperone SecB [Rhizobiales bacterium]|nr:protein-export chaperone SecB [Hyphomicrobiales bacterium]
MAKSPKKKKSAAPAASPPPGAAPAPGPGGNGAAPSLNVLAQYVKDFSFENPNAPESLAAGPKNPQIQIQINVNAKKIGENEYEVELDLDAEAVEDDKVVFKVALVYAGMMRLQNVPEQNLQAIVLVECPRILFPFARQIIAEATRNGGYPPLMLEPIDFMALFQQKAAAQQAAPTN